MVRETVWVKKKYVRPRISSSFQYHAYISSQPFKAVYAEIKVTSISPFKRV